MNDTPRGQRLHIGIFGRRNAGKSSLINAITGQDAALVSPIKGTTTDPVYKAMELLPIGPVVFIDTPGIDDTGALGALRIEKARGILRKTDLALLVIDAREGLSGYDRELICAFDEAGVQYLTVYNKADLVEGEAPEGIAVSAATGEHIHRLKEEIARLCAEQEEPRRLVADLLAPGDVIVLVVPIDSAAPKGRLILPQQQVIRDALEAGAIAVVTQPQGLAEAFAKLGGPPKLVVTDSQAFAQVAELTPESVPLTSFSILMARYKGVLEDAVAGARVINALKDGDKILIAEGCTHHRQCEDIGTVKLPMWIEQRTGAKPEYVFSSGGGFPADLSAFQLVIHCGGCMQNPREM
ncbi:MAG: [FeFe] hydrogenase H-cluster maturation GTPase HydF, partial [Oscillospiraceae bacterium]|nr:[FeFe] hydrogenase H-cluster maturation GTPase HydF [Oscillospiraceae bacterium]